jgi:glucokinase
MTYSIGIDVGGTKTAAGLIELPVGRVLARRLQPTMPERGAEAVLADVVAISRSLLDEAQRLKAEVVGIGVGVAELVGSGGRVLSEATIRWKEIDVCGCIESATSLSTILESDVRAAARGEAHLGAGRTFRSFLYVTIGTGISASLVLRDVPYEGAHGVAGYFASSPLSIGGEKGELVTGPPLEQFAAGPALVARLTALCPEFLGSAPDVLALAEAGDPIATSVVDSAGQALGAAIANLVNMLDPQVIVMGGGLGLAGGRYRDSLEETLRARVYSDCHRDLPLLDAKLGADAGWIGAALCAISRAKLI